MHCHNCDEDMGSTTAKFCGSTCMAEKYGISDRDRDAADRDEVNREATEDADQGAEVGA